MHKFDAGVIVSRVVYISWPAQEITGGIKMVFRHVESLNEAEISATVATSDGERPRWFDSAASVIPLSEIKPTDSLVFPENDVELLREFRSTQHPKFVFCQNQYMVFRGLADANCYSDYGVSEIICPSHSALHYCRRRFPHMKLGYIPYYIDHQVFRCPQTKRLQIAFAPRKRPLEAAFVRDLFRAEYSEFREIPWLQISGASESQVAAALSQSAVFLSLSKFESCGLTTLEALASGCITAGFTGWGGNEYATAKNGFWAAEDDCFDCTDQLFRAVKLAVDGDSTYNQIVNDGVATARTYHKDIFANRLTAYWKNHLQPDPVEDL